MGNYINLRKQQQEAEWQKLWEDDGEDPNMPRPYILATGQILWMDRDTLHFIGIRGIKLVNGAYPAISIKGKYVKLHHIVMGKPPAGFVTDHINRNTLDNRRANLRFCTPQENSLNTFRSSGEYILTPIEVRMKATEEYYRRIFIQCQPKSTDVNRV